MALSSTNATCAVVEERYDAFGTTVVATALLDQTAIDRHTDEIAQHAVDDVQRVKCMERHMDAWTALNEQRVRTILCQPSPIDALYGEIGASFNDLDAILKEHKRLVAVWSECGFLGRLAFFESVRMNRGNWDQNFAMRADGTETADMVAPDGLLLDMLERVLLGAQDGAQDGFGDAVETFKRTLHAVVAPSPKGGPIGVLMSMQDHWYITLEDRECTVAVEELANRPDAEDAEATAYLFLRWFGKAFGRWAAAIPAPSLALAYVVPGALATTPPGMQRYVDVLRGSGVSRTSRMFIRIERVRLWLKADTAEVKATGGRIKFGETYRPYVLHIFDNDAHGSVDLKRMMKRRWATARTVPLHSPLRQCTLLTTTRALCDVRQVLGAEPDGSRSARIAARGPCRSQEVAQHASHRQLRARQRRPLRPLAPASSRGPRCGQLLRVCRACSRRLTSDGLLMTSAGL